MCTEEAEQRIRKWVVDAKTAGEREAGARQKAEGDKGKVWDTLPLLPPGFTNPDWSKAIAPKFEFSPMFNPYFSNMMDATGR